MYLRTFHFQFLLIILGFNSLPSQDVEVLQLNLESIQEQRERVLVSLDFTISELGTLSGRKKDLLDTYNLLSTQMDLRETLTQLIVQEVEIIDSLIGLNQRIIQNLDSRLEKVQDSYFAFLRMTYKYKLAQNKWLHFLSSESLSKVILRYQYLNQFELFTSRETERVNEIEERLLLKNQELIDLSALLTANLEMEKETLKQLKSEVRSKSALIAEINKNKSKTQSRLSTVQRERESSGNIIKRSSGSKANNDATILNKETLDNPATTAFRQKKGALIWPVEKGIVYEKFGRKRHEVVKNIWIENNGVVIRSEEGQYVKTVANGDVIHTPKISTNGYMIIIRHGDYMSSYFTLANIFVKKGDKVSEGQVIGQLTKAYNVIPILNFEIWHAYDKLNPELWLRKR